MTTDIMTAVLKMHPFVDELEPEHLAKLSELAREVHFERGQIIFREGEECRYFYLIMSGKIALEIAGPGHPFLVQTLGAGEELGWSSMLKRGGRRFQAKAVERSEAIAFDAEDLRRICHQDPALGLDVTERLLGIVSERLDVTRLQLIDIYSPRAGSGDFKR